MSDKPLNVQVAEALGWQRVHVCSAYPDEFCGEPPACLWAKKYDYGDRGGCCPEEFRRTVIDYDTDWAATGPLIHRFKLRILPMWDEYGGRDWRWQITPYHSLGSHKEGFQRFGDSDNLGPLMAHADRDPQTNAVIFLDAPTELVGVCCLLVAMGKAGWLEARWLENPPGEETCRS